MTEKLMHVSFMVKDTNLHALLISIEGHKVGNLEVRAVQPRLALPAPNTGRDSTVARVARVMTPKRKMRPKEVAAELGITTKQANSALHNLLLRKFVRRPRNGIFVRVNGAAS